MKISLSLSAITEMAFIHPQLRPIVAKMSFLDRNLFRIIHAIDKFGSWHRLPVFLGLTYLGIRRHLHQHYNLLSVGGIIGHKYDTNEYTYRTADGKFNDPSDDLVGSQGTFFGRNMPPSSLQNEFMEPHPTIVATKLLARKTYKDNGKQFNLIAASWIQFMVHDWIDHMEETQQMEIKAPDDNVCECPLKSFKFFKSKEVSTSSSDVKIGFLNRRTAWWDGSAIYGNNEKVMKKVRTFKDGKLKISENDLLQHDKKGIPISGEVRNNWAGVLILQALFVKEHNVICDMLKDHHPDFDDGKLYRYSRLVISAVIAKVHTIDWTVELLKTNTLLAGMRTNWYGLLGKKFKDMFGHVFGASLSGLVGLKQPSYHGVPYSLTEEFTSVYRMHSLLPDTIQLRDFTTTTQDHTPKILEEVPMGDMVGLEGEKRLTEIGMEQMMLSMGYQTSGALTLWNYPSWMRNLVVQDINGEDRPDPVDLASLEIYRDRERKVARYNEFRRNMLMIPISKWEDLTDNEETLEALKEVYGDNVEKLDLIVGLHVEKKIKGFAISETAFYIFLVMASRRLEGDRFFTTDFNSKTYTKEGFDWVNKTESLKDVINRHYPNMAEKWIKSSSAFSVWDLKPTPTNYVPLYLRFAT